MQFGGAAYLCTIANQRVYEVSLSVKWLLFLSTNQQEIDLELHNLLATGLHWSYQQKNLLMKNFVDDEWDNHQMMNIWRNLINRWPLTIKIICDFQIKKLETLNLMIEFANGETVKIELVSAMESGSDFKKTKLNL